MLDGQSGLLVETILTRTEAEPGFPAPVLQALRSQPDDGYDGPPLLVTDATLTSAQYETDRGPRVLPTWVVQAQGARCGPPAPSVRSGAATARPDDHLSRDVS